jgi:hypothetical protein
MVRRWIGWRGGGKGRRRGVVLCSRPPVVPDVASELNRRVGGVRRPEHPRKHIWLDLGTRLHQDQGGCDLVTCVGHIRTTLCVPTNNKRT